MQSDHSDEIMSTRDAAKCLGVSVRTVQLWVESGSLQAWKTPGGHRRIFRQSVNEMLAARTAMPNVSEFFEILICSGDATAVSLMEEQLTALGSQVRIRKVSNGFEALIQMGERCPNLLITDLFMPNMDGLQMLKALQNTAFVQTMKIIVASELHEDEEVEKRGGFPPGVTKFSKSAPFDQLLSLVTDYIDVSKTQSK
ncbi:excisionase family DNA-binding protein [Solimicrobium silvestre]|uniref:Excise: DNA binding domain, excisionase family n=1 Tax=Solimicrobium silvestre TaxID=2099400 RepID=A0A2S9GU43_9BURK|nr:excisionase family DNA-binding protein [Solimicrobium silvestre]PRC91221.1 excise: DNA binding domain, excisionase family [Solimicrobium silvestre]